MSFCNDSYGFCSTLSGLNSKLPKACSDPRVYCQSQQKGSGDGSMGNFSLLDRVEESAGLLFMLLVVNLRFVGIRVVLSGPKVMVWGTCRQLHLVCEMA